MPGAKTAARKALELDETPPEAHTSRGWVAFLYEWDWDAAEREWKRAIELNPDNALALDHHATLLASLGRFAEASAESQRARELDPLSVLIIMDSGFSVLI